MTLKIVPATLTAPPVAFTVTVPGNERWTVRSVCATVQRGATVDAARGYLLTIVSSGFTLGAVGATDPGSGVGLCVVTWADAPASEVAFGPDGYAVAPFAAVPLDPGYVLDGGMVHNHAGDAFTSVNVWLDYIPA